MSVKVFRFLPLAFVMLFLAPVTFAQSPTPEQPFTPEQTRRWKRRSTTTSCGHPELLVEALQDAKREQQKESDERVRHELDARQDELYNDPSSPVGGNPKGDVTIVEFFDYRCPFCKLVQPSIEALLEQDSNLRIIYKEYPILGEPSIFAARVALAARKQGKFDAFHVAMMATKGEAAIDDRVVLDVAQSVGLRS